MQTENWNLILIREAFLLEVQLKKYRMNFDTKYLSSAELRWQDRVPKRRQDLNNH